ncbi:agmatinase [Catenulispora sp. GP43]|uniref:agmatinase n=1 Tax=Catenulispora sp. GP43 TaxID=3156263 RepID=UPI003512345A
MPQRRLPDQAFTSQTLRGTAVEAVFAGATSMFRRRYAKSMEGADAVFVGAPLDSASSGRPGSRFGPRAMRAASSALSHGAVWPWGFDPFDVLAAVDWGDIAFDLSRSEAFLEAADQAYSGFGEAVPITLGGDHFTSYPAVRALARRHGKLGLLHFDAHSDTWVDPVRHHGSVFFHAMRDGFVDRRRLVQVGIRTHNPVSHGSLVMTAHTVRRSDPAQLAAAIAGRIGDGPVYITFDLDCLDPSVAPGTGTPVPGGLSVGDVKDIVYELAGHRLDIVGIDMVEMTPAYDVSDITALAGTSLLLDLVCLLAGQRAGSGRPDPAAMG